MKYHFLCSTGNQSRALLYWRIRCWYMLIASPILYFTPVSVSTFFVSRCLFFFLQLYFGHPWESVCLSLSGSVWRFSFSPSLSLSVSLSVIFCFPLLRSGLPEQQCLPLLLHPCLLLVFLIRWQYIQGFFSLVFLTVTLHLDKTENKGGGRVEGKKNRLLTYLQISPALSMRAQNKEGEGGKVSRLLTPSILLFSPTNPSPLQPDTPSPQFHIF